MHKIIYWWVGIRDKWQGKIGNQTKNSDTGKRWYYFYYLPYFHEKKFKVSKILITNIFFGNLAPTVNFLNYCTFPMLIS